MGLLRYLRDHLASEVVFLCAFFLVGWSLALTETSQDTGLLVLLVLALAEAARIAIGYLPSARYWRELREVADALNPLFVAADLPEPTSSEARAADDAIDAVRTEAQRQVSEARRDAAEYRDFIELWSHEVKTPLAAASLELANHPGETAEALAPQLQRVQSYVDQALFMARSYTVGRDYVVRRVPLSQVVGVPVRERMSTLMAAGARVSTEGLDQEVPCDPKWTSFIVGQLIDNAVKYAADRPLEIHLSAERLGTGTAAERVVLRVADNGVGIAAQDLPRIWDKGFTGENGRTTAGGTSTGIGLYLVRTLCDKTGLSCTAFSDGRTGTAVEVTFPALGLPYAGVTQA
ncbi:sensor histidine kinase [Olsenella sp. YH-ols2217]|uniref:histidine kinase n=1 Tax=Kribbibacterium absianum TaxID=3044210 RepID=A0ABT6ZJW6_9ACTN|nr:MULTISPECIES: sensor histidine kinase [unclassified Olsenella]MDJ1122415.1 sensor histidine kinase [Olsenella sp. YH-ols2216]MDJ1129331.1 sensor histidine kinase [Olsenella sp. YH-ols2217]